MKRTVFLAVCAILAVALAAAFWRFAAASRSRQGGEPRGADQNSAAVATHPAAKTNDTAAASSSDESAVDGALENAVTKAVSPVGPGGDAAVKLTVEQRARLRDKVFLEEDAAFLKSPSYEERRDEMLAEAQAVLDRVGSSNTKAVIDASQAELDEFWKAGALSAAEGYDHGYLARAILERALEKDPENFQLLSMYKESVSTTTPFYVVDADVSKDPKAVERLAKNHDLLFDIADRQRALIVSGKVPPSPDAMLAIHDFTWLAYARKDYKSGDESLKWLVNNAAACSCDSMKGMFEQILTMAREKNARPMGNVYIYTERDPRKDAINLRRIPSFKGSPDRRAQIVGLWQTEGGNFNISFK